MHSLLDLKLAHQLDRDRYHDIADRPAPARAPRPTRSPRLFGRSRER